MHRVGWIFCQRGAGAVCEQHASDWRRLARPRVEQRVEHLVQQQVQGRRVEAEEVRGLLRPAMFLELTLQLTLQLLLLLLLLLLMIKMTVQPFQQCTATQQRVLPKPPWLRETR